MNINKNHVQRDIKADGANRSIWVDSCRSTECLIQPYQEKEKTHQSQLNESDSGDTTLSPDLHQYQIQFGLKLDTRDHKTSDAEHAMTTQLELSISWSVLFVQTVLRCRVRVEDRWRFQKRDRYELWKKIDIWISRTIQKLLTNIRGITTTR